MHKPEKLFLKMLLLSYMVKEIKIINKFLKTKNLIIPNQKAVILLQQDTVVTNPLKLIIAEVYIFYEITQEVAIYPLMI